MTSVTGSCPDPPRLVPSRPRPVPYRGPTPIRPGTCQPAYAVPSGVWRAVHQCGYHAIMAIGSPARRSACRERVAAVAVVAGWWRWRLPSTYLLWRLSIPPYLIPSRSVPVCYLVAPDTSGACSAAVAAIFIPPLHGSPIYPALSRRVPARWRLVAATSLYPSCPVSSCPIPYRRDYPAALPIRQGQLA